MPNAVYFYYLCARMKRILLNIAFVFCLLPLCAADSTGNIRVSVLTCSPGQEVYSLYGHTAIRVQDLDRGEDHVFNYGVFDFNTEYFVWKFVLGETDYICMAVPWEYFVREYEARGSSVVAQVLNLTDAEACKVRDYLYRNIRKENRVYRYNFLTNNCTTRVMDCVESCVEGGIVYSWKVEPRTYRQILHEYTAGFPWSQEGNDFLLGADVDTLLSHRATCFIPEYYMEALDGAVVRNEFQDTRNLVAETQTVVPLNLAKVKKQADFPLSPVELGWLVFAVAVIIMAVEFMIRRMFWLLDVVLMLAHGLAGCLILFMFLFSQHPTLDSNWLVAVLNPLPLIALPFVLKAAWNDRQTLWHHFMAVWMAVFLLFIPWMPQHMGMLVIPILATLLSRQISYIFHYGRPRVAVSTKGRSRRNTSRKKR